MFRDWRHFQRQTKTIKKRSQSVIISTVQFVYTIRRIIILIIIKIIKRNENNELIVLKICRFVSVAQCVNCAKFSPSLCISIDYRRWVWFIKYFWCSQDFREMQAHTKPSVCLQLFIHMPERKLCNKLVKLRNYKSNVSASVEKFTKNIINFLKTYF